MNLEKDFEDFVSLLNKHQVEYFTDDYIKKLNVILKNQPSALNL